MHDLVELYPTAWNVSHMAQMACEIGDGKLARSYFEVLPAGDDGRSGWNSGSGTNTTKYRECRSTAGYTS